ncbi:hypothetical protein OG689_35930 [Kitasatospora sp. NBC_00240]|uniref:hypothetical protein n=1 Tax=Kitasatospora sp. NBC_00240 TaxID=2903567 RepID=UPI00224DB848|nr:hypothetical protein [Kitasatospora sp. NBC_00240]MCX5214586.1 hypothetical protein [Kitasatospora sp. NBC_00240]
MPDVTSAGTPEDVIGLVRQTPLSFLGRVVRLGGTPLSGVGADERTAVVQVDDVLHAPDAFRRLAGSEVTVQLSSDLDPPAVGDTAVFFTKGAVYGEGLAVDEVGRLPADAVRTHLTHAATTADAMPFTAVQRGIREEDLAAHAAEADAVVVGDVVGLEKVPGAEGPLSEHAPDWWRARLEVRHVESGDRSLDRIDVLYPNSRDIHWYRVPKPKAGQEGLWFLHATQAPEGVLREAAPFQLLHPDDYQPAQMLAVLRERR